MEQNEINDSKLDQAIAKFESEIEKKNEEKIVIDRNDIKKLIAMLPNGKSSGFSEASNEMFKYGTSNTLIHLISALIEKIINSGIIPSFFNVGKISPIIKDPNKSKSDYNNVRPITVSDTLTNIYKKIVLIELDKTHCGSPNQFGFANKSSCNHAVFALKETILNTIKKNKAVYAVAIDASKAFDKINRKNLFHTLIGKIKPIIWRSLKNYYRCSMAYIEKEGEISEIFKTTIGVKQGGPLSPKLFAIYIEELVELVEKENLGIKIQDLQIGIILYADDIIILSDDEKKIQRALEICEEFGSKKEIKFNPDKTQLISLNAIGVLGINDKNLKTKIKVQLYKTYCRPILSYGCEALKINQIDQRKLKTIEGTIIKRIMGLGKRAKTTKLLHALEMETTEIMLLKGKLNFVKRLM
ncbi:RNA-directed DNA polymerase from mobile element jockey-like, partial [Brachionus plicatilis]